jgi:hypothetical protein
MSYFSKFPQYITNAGDRKNVVITDFFRRVSHGNKFQEYSVFLLPYLVLDGETPEMVSNKFYNNPLYHWVILLINGITDPRTEWVMTDRQLNAVMFQKYDFAITVPDVTKYSKNDVVTSSNNGAFVVKEVGSTTIRLRSTKGAITLATTDTLTNVTKNLSLSMLSIVDPLEHIHHYVDSTTNLVIDYDNTNPHLVAISNFEYEQDVNEKKRIIKVLDVKYVNEFVKDFENLVNR